MNCLIRINIALHKPSFHQTNEKKKKLVTGLHFRCPLSNFLQLKRYRYIDVVHRERYYPFCIRIGKKNSFLKRKWLCECMNFVSFHPDGFE